MNKKEIIERLENFELDKTQYWVITGSAMVLYGLRENTHDIDLGCSKELADELMTQGYPVELLEDGTRKITIGENIEIFENWIWDEVVIVDSIPVISLKGLLEMKKRLGREKDERDIKLIEEFLAKQNRNAI